MRLLNVLATPKCWLYRLTGCVWILFFFIKFREPQVVMKIASTKVITESLNGKIIRKKKKGFIDRNPKSYENMFSVYAIELITGYEKIKGWYYR